MAKLIPTEQLIALYNKMLPYAARHAERKILIRSFADSFGICESTVRRQLRKHVLLNNTSRFDMNRPRVTSADEMLLYCQIIAALKLRTSNKKNKHLSTQTCITILEKHGVNLEQGLIKAPKGTLKKTTINRYLKNWGYDQVSMKIEPPVVRFEAEHSNDCWQFDFTPSELKQLSPQDDKKLFIANIIDDKSGVLYYEYVQTNGEDTLTALKFLFNAMAAKKNLGIPLQGIPKIIYTDNGAFAKSLIFKRALSALGVELKTHMPKGSDGRRTTARSKGKIERANRTVKESFEPLFHLHRPNSFEEANLWAVNYLIQYNNMPHRSEKCTRLESWRQFLPVEGYREMCTWEQFCLMVREPESRKVSSDGCVSINGVQYQLTSEMAGMKVMVQHGIFDQEIYVEFDGQLQGPYYKSAGPHPLNEYKKAKKNDREKRADAIEELANKLSVPVSVMTGECNDVTVTQLKKAHVIKDNVISIPFEPKVPVTFKNRLEAKQMISVYLNRPLASLNKAQLAYIDQIVTETLEKEEILSRVKHFFSLKLCKFIEK